MPCLLNSPARFFVDCMQSMCSIYLPGKFYIKCLVLCWRACLVAWVLGCLKKAAPEKSTRSQPKARYLIGIGSGRAFWEFLDRLFPRVPGLCTFWEDHSSGRLTKNNVQTFLAIPLGKRVEQDTVEGITQVSNCFRTLGDVPDSTL